MLRKLLILVILAGALAPRIADAQPGHVETLLGLMQDRLQIMANVAKSKWTHHLPVEDGKREAALLAAVADQAPDYGVSADVAVEFFRAQIEAAKIIQTALFERWGATGQGGFFDAPDLVTTVRPLLDGLTPRLLAALAAALPDLADPEERTRVQEVPVLWQSLPDAWAIATAPLLMSQVP